MQIPPLAMTRGRKKDLTIPPSRTLTQQRDYRARKAHYVADLEERCRKAEEENVRLRKELADVRAQATNPALLLPQTVSNASSAEVVMQANPFHQADAAAELMQNLALAQDSIAKFQQIVFPGSQNTSSASTVCSAQRPLDHQTPNARPRPLLDPHTDDSIQGRKRLYVDDLPPFSSTPTTFQESSPSSSSECCGGLLNCDGLCESDDDDNNVNVIITRTSGLRSTGKALDSVTMNTWD